MRVRYHSNPTKVVLTCFPTHVTFFPKHAGSSTPLASGLYWEPKTARGKDIPGCGWESVSLCQGMSCLSESGGAIRMKEEKKLMRVKFPIQYNSIRKCALMVIAHHLSHNELKEVCVFLGLFFCRARQEFNCSCSLRLFSLFVSNVVTWSIFGCRCRQLGHPYIWANLQGTQVKLSRTVSTGTDVLHLKYTAFGSIRPWKARRGEPKDNL